MCEFSAHVAYNKSQTDKQIYNTKKRKQSAECHYLKIVVEILPPSQRSSLEKNQSETYTIVENRINVKTKEDTRTNKQANNKTNK